MHGSKSVLILSMVFLIGFASAGGAEARYSQSEIQQTVNEVSKPDRGTSAAKPVHVRKRAAHWKTKYWNQKTAPKVKAQ